MKTSTYSFENILQPHIKELRKIIVLLGIDSLKLRTLFTTPQQINIPPQTLADRLVRAAVALGMMKNEKDGSVVWDESYIKLAQSPTEWKKMIELFNHHTSYLTLAHSLPLHQEEHCPVASQLLKDPAAYKDFLTGVAVSHQQHSLWFANLPEFSGRKELVDLGSGLGTFSTAWVASEPDREAIMIDLPQVDSLLNKETSLLKKKNRLAFYGDNLINPSFEQVNKDIYLLANVLHLIPDPSALMKYISRQAGPYSLICIFEATNNNEPGILFDLQVSIRSEGRSGLLSDQEITDLFEQTNLTVCSEILHFDPLDPFNRTYKLWIAKPKDPTIRNK